jgi:hypothetical protein
MKAVMRMVVMAALVLGANGARADHDPYSANAPHPRNAESTSDAPEAADPWSAPQVQTGGAGSMEPSEGVDEDPGSDAHEAWVESIWNSP